VDDAPADGRRARGRESLVATAGGRAVGGHPTRSRRARGGARRGSRWCRSHAVRRAGVPRGLPLRRWPPLRLRPWGRRRASARHPRVAMEKSAAGDAGQTAPTIRAPSRHHQRKGGRSAQASAAPSPARSVGGARAHLRRRLRPMHAVADAAGHRFRPPSPAVLRAAATCRVTRRRPDAQRLSGRCDRRTWTRRAHAYCLSHLICPMEKRLWFRRMYTNQPQTL